MITVTDWTVKNEKTMFTHGKEAYTEAARTAEKCGLFSEDCEDELVCDDAVSCYNCRYRRWTADSFECIKR